jgi:hypothetical protein
LKARSTGEAENREKIGLQTREKRENVPHGIDEVWIGESTTAARSALEGCTNDRE